MTGSGTLADPYVISTIADFDAIRNDLAANYRMGNDLDFASTGLTVIQGASGAGFTGSLDGNGKVIRNFSYDATGEDGGHWQMSVFGGQVSAHIHDIGFENLYYRGGRRTGGIVSSLVNGGIIERCYVTGEVVSTRHEFGGIVGYKDSSTTVRNCWVDAYIWGDETVNTASQGAGICGNNSGSGDQVIDCLFLNTVDTGINDTTVGEDAPIVSNGQMDNGYYDSDVYPNPTTPSPDAVGLSTSVLQSGNPLSGFDTNVWTFNAGEYPKLSWQTTQADTTPPAAPTSLSATIITV